MRLTLYTDFALRVLIQVGLNDGKLTTINDVARSFGISKPHLMKVVNDLGQKGYLNTVRGRNGGIRLIGEPRHINIGQVVATRRINSTLLAALGVEDTAQSSASACFAALYAMRLRRFWGS
jgi:Rrf2 family nitric oxide-sensitive transcriptional repressor